MITYVNGDLFTSPAAVLVNTVNTVGVMGKGIAKEFKRNFPEMFNEYRTLCENGELNIGSLHLYRTDHKSVLNFPTKKHWRSPSKTEYIEAGLKTFVRSYERFGIDSIAFPQLGCGNGELDWESQVRPVMENYLKDLPIRVYIHAVGRRVDIPEHRDQRAMKEWLNSEPEYLPVSEVWSDLIASVRTDATVAGWRVDILTSQVVVPDSDSLREIPEEVIRFRKGEHSVQISRDDILPIWRKLSVLGLINEKDLPAPVQYAGAPLLELLLRLQYLSPVEFVSPRRSGEGAEPGLMLIPRSAVQQRQLSLLAI